MTDRHGCEECRGTTRRGFLRGTAALGLTGLATATLGTRLAFATTPAYGGDVLVVLSLRGGFDGLSAVVPGGDADYYSARPTIGIPQASLLPLDRTWGLNSALSPLLPLWQSGALGAVVAVGQPVPTRSHFRDTEAMERAAPSSTLRTGWLDRALGLRPSGNVFQAVQLGTTAGQQWAGPFRELSMESVDEFDLHAAGGDDPEWAASELRRWRGALTRLYKTAPAPLASPAATALSALATSRSLKAQGYTPSPLAGYDDSSELARALRDVARLVKAKVGLQVATVDFGDWDMHSGLGRAGSGWMHDKLTELGKALAAFATDLGPELANVTVVTLSEFGRRVHENDSAGVDHGHGNTVLVLGGGVEGGRVHGSWPGLSREALDDGDVAGTTDYRTVLAEVLARRCGQTSLSTVFPGLPSGALGVVRTR